MKSRKNLFILFIFCGLGIWAPKLQGSIAPYYEVQVALFGDPPTSEFVFIQNSDGVNSWAGEDSGALEGVAINDNLNSAGVGTPSEGFYDSQGAVVVYNVPMEAGNGAFCALSSSFPIGEGGPGASGIPLNLNDVTLQVDVAFDVPGHPEITSLSKALNFWVQEADGDNFEFDVGEFDLTRNWQTYEYELDNLPPEVTPDGVFGNSAPTLVSVEFEDPASPTGLDTIIYFIDNFRLVKSGETIFLEDFEPQLDIIDIDWIWFKIEKNYTAGTPETEPFDIGALVFGSNLNSVKVTSPADVTEYLEEGPGYWYWDRDEKFASLEDLYVKFPIGNYEFTFNEGQANEDSAIVYVNPEYPTGFGNITNPTDGATDVPLNPTFEWSSCSMYGGDILFVGVGDIMADEDIYMEELNINETSWTPGSLPQGCLCSFGVSVQTRSEVSGTTDNGDTFNFRDVGQWSNGITFTTVPPPSADPIEEIEEILDLVDESVEDGTLTGEGPGNSADNRLNALRNKLEDARRLIEAGRYEEACDQLWSTYRKCDGESRPPDFVTGEAADDLADMILVMMDDLGC